MASRRQSKVNAYTGPSPLFGTSNCFSQQPLSMPASEQTNRRGPILRHRLRLTQTQARHPHKKHTQYQQHHKRLSRPRLNAAAAPPMIASAVATTLMVPTQVRHQASAARLQATSPKLTTYLSLTKLVKIHLAAFQYFSCLDSMASSHGASGHATCAGKRRHCFSVGALHRAWWWLLT